MMTTTMKMVTHRHEVPTGSVKIRSVQSGKYLAGSSPYDRERRTITLESSPEEWSLVKDGSHYRITLKNGNEDLYAFDKAGYNPDSGQREVFTWIPGFGESQGRWEVKEAPGYSGIYYVRNLHFDEYLYTSCCENKALTRKGFGEPDGNSMFLWQVTAFCLHFTKKDNVLHHETSTQSVHRNVPRKGNGYAPSVAILDFLRGCIPGLRG
ncbi:uncharacterized protein LOC120414281 [Culex pipiens pallens]|uniref:uncharacterized protein LOC120414281 n=1 Tax=Culex pipiens pallens TaxID=42434 RepID=UPI0022AAD2DD|nr:uncharacterized protein LOC120414281 [Culex pipiens pallens]